MPETLLYERPLDRALNEAPLHQWTFIHENLVRVWVLKTPECRACIQDNYRVYEDVLEWKCTVSRVSHWGVSIKGPDLEELKKKCVEEMAFLESIKIPARSNPIPNKEN